MSNEVAIWNYFKSQGLTDYAVAGIMGNLYAESGLLPNNLQNNYESILGMTDEQYTQAVDNGSYTNFVNDSAGYGLAQWTFWSRKSDLLSLARKENKSIGYLYTQLEFLCSELKEFGLWDKLNNCQSVQDASNIILFEYEKPLDMSTSVQNARGNWGREYYNKYHNSPTYPTIPTTVPTTPTSDKYCIVAVGKFPDKQTAVQYANEIQSHGMTCFLTKLES